MNQIVRLVEVIINVPEGYRLLRKGEALDINDEIYDITCECWDSIKIFEDDFISMDEIEKWVKQGRFIINCDNIIAMRKIT